MRTQIHTLATITLALIGQVASATTYYVSPSGNDSNNGTSQGTAWRTIERVQSLGYTMQPGDQVLFERGGSYPGQLTINSSGTASQPIVFGAYGSGNKPEISGAILPTAWTVHQGNIWHTNIAQPVKYVRVGSTMMTLARYPNTGWMRVATSNNTHLTSGDLTQGNGYWNGAELVIRTTGWCYENATVNASGSGSLDYSSIIFNPGNLQWGFYLQNKLSELDAPGEWYHDATAGVLYFRAPNNADPNTLEMKASVYENGLDLGWERTYINVQDLAFRGQRYAGVNIGGASHVNITGCTFDQTHHGIRSYGSYGNYSNNTVRNTFASGLAILDHHTTIENNTIEDIALFPGLGEPFWGYFGMYCRGQENTVRGNTVNRVGNSGIFMEGSGVVEHNIITHALATVNDGGGIYFDNADGLIIQDNFVSDLDGNMESQAMDGGVNFKIGHGIYFGNAVIHDVIVRRNTVHNCRGAGINVDHTMVSSGIQVRNNILYDNDMQLSITDLSNYNGPGATWPYYVASYNDIYDGNILYCTNKEQLCMQQYLVHGAQQVDFGTHTNNKFFNPFNESNIFIINVTNGTVVHRTLEDWRHERNEETGSTISPHHQNANEVLERTGPDMVPNGGFGSNVNGWTGWPTTGVLQRDPTYLDNGAMKVTYAPTASSTEYYLRNDFMNTVNGQWYEMRFSTQSNLYGNVRAEFKSQSQSTGPLSMSSRDIPYSPVRRDVSITFQNTGAEPGLLMFAHNSASPSYWLDNVELFPVTVETIDPYDRHILLKNPTGAAISKPITGCWSDVQGNIHTNSVNIPAWGSITLAKESDDSCDLTTGLEDNLVASTTQSIYPNPMQQGGSIFLTRPVPVLTEVEVFDTGGRTIYHARMMAGTREVPTRPNLVQGNYVVQLRGKGAVEHFRLVVQ